MQLAPRSRCVLLITANWCGSNFATCSTFIQRYVKFCWLSFSCANYPSGSTCRCHKESRCVVPSARLIGQSAPTGEATETGLSTMVHRYEVHSAFRIAFALYLTAQDIYIVWLGFNWCHKSANGARVHYFWVACTLKSKIVVRGQFTCLLFGN